MGTEQTQVVTLLNCRLVTLVLTKEKSKKNVPNTEKQSAVS